MFTNTAHLFCLSLSAMGLFFSADLLASENDTTLELGIGVSYMGAEDGTKSNGSAAISLPYNQITPQLSAGLYRPINEHWQLGTGLSLDWSVSSSLHNSRSLLTLDMIELIQLWSPHISSRYSFGFIRYFRYEPAFDYSLSIAIDGHFSQTYFIELGYTYASADIDTVPNQNPDFANTYINLINLSLKRRF